MHRLVAEAAELTFEAWTHSDDEWTPPTNEEWILCINPVLAPAQLAWRTLFKSKAELVKVVDNLDDDDVEAFIGKIRRSAEFFKNFHLVMQAAEARLFCAVAARAPDELDAAPVLQAEE